MTDYKELLIPAIAAADAAAAFIRSAQRPTDSTDWGVKGASDYVTDVDRGAEALIAETIERHLPGSTVMGEELTPASHDTDTGDLVWVVDPLDGTTNYLHGYPAYAVSIAAVVDGYPRVGVVEDVANRVRYHAVERGGAWIGDQPLHISIQSDPEHCLIGTGFPFKHPQHLPSYLRQFTQILQATSGVRRAGAAALDLAHLACGYVDGFWELALAPWDVAAGTLLVREAGGRVTDSGGADTVIDHGSIVAGNAAIHEWLLAVLQR